MKRSMFGLFCLLLAFCAAVSFAGCGSDEGGHGSAPTSSVTPSSLTTSTATAGTSAAIPEADVSDYFPFTENVFKKFRGTGNEFAEYETYVDYSREGVLQIRNVNPGTSSVSVYMVENGDLKRVFFEGETYFRHDLTHLRGRDEIIIKAPIKEGTEWVSENGEVSTITGLDVAVDVPAGSFRALEITVRYMDSTVKNYYAIGAGLVKTEFISLESPDSAVTSELEQIRGDIPFTQLVSFYYPDYAADETLIDTRDLVLYTGDGLESFFETELKKIPEGTDLAPLISANTSILSIDPLSIPDMVKIDFSNELISEMNAGAGFESMILSCLAKTFGNYYQRSKVIITVGGKPYSSGHIEFGEGEYIDLSTLTD